jgi:thiamine biosynthesis lipoprotein
MIRALSAPFHKYGEPPRASCRGHRGIFLALTLAAAGLGVAGCAERAPPLTEQRLYSMGTWVDITLAAPRETAAAGLADVARMLHGFERDYYAWSDGELARVNEALAAGRTLTVSPELAEVLRRAKRVSMLSDGAFDPAVGALVELWGFHSALDTPAAPAPEAVTQWLESRGSIADVGIEGRRVSSTSRAVVLDLGGIAKGEAVDRAVELLRRHGVDSALVNAGGNVRAIGTREGRPWHIGIKAPRGDGILGFVELADGEAASTSGDYERYFEQDGRRLHHLLDPRTGYPAVGTDAVTVIAGSGVDADAASTALFVAGPKRWRKVAAALGIALALRVDASGTVEVTQDLARRLQPADGAPSVSVVTS